MIKALEKHVLGWLRVPPEPTPPIGSPGSLRVFRAGRNYLRLRVVVWAGAQLGAIFGVLVSLSFVREVEIQAEWGRVRDERAAADDGPVMFVPGPKLEESMPRGPMHQLLYDVAPRWLRDLPREIPPQALGWIWIAEILGLVGFVVQLGWTLFAVRLDYGLRWYMVTDRSLRLRWGVLTIQESTMSFANLQQVSVHQGPLQRLLKLADVEVQSAGGGSGVNEHGQKESMHRSTFHAVDNAAEIRDLILMRLQRFRQAGLGDPDDPNDAHAGLTQATPDLAPGAIAAARELLTELQAWRRSARG